MDNEQNPSVEKRSSLAPWIITILIAAWILAMGIVIAGWLISKQIALNSLSNTLPVTQPARVNIDVPAGMPVLGDNNAPVTVIEFADFQCPFCSEWQKLVFPQLKTQYIDTGKIRFVYMDYAFLGQESFRAAEAARCAHDQGKFWEYHDTLLQNQKGENENAFSDVNLKQFAKNLALDENKFSFCLESNTYQKAVEDALQKGSEYGVEATPTVFIDGYEYEGLLNYSIYASAIDDQLSK